MQTPTIVAVEVADNEHVGVDQPDHDIIDSAVYLAEMYTVIRCMHHVLDQFVSVEPCAIIKGIIRVVWRCELRVGAYNCQYKTESFPP